MVSENKYIIKGGAEGKERLEVLSGILADTTRSLIEANGSVAGKHFLDLGSGGGGVALMASEMVGADGRVTAIDFDKEIIRLCIEDAKMLSIQNISYRELDAGELDYENEFDIAYARFLLSHLQNPQTVLNKMARAVKKGGRVIIEDIDFSGHFCHPPSGAFDLYLKLFVTAAGNNGQNANIGQELFSMFNNEPMLDQVKADVIQPCFNEGKGKWMAFFTMDKIKEAVLDQKLADRATIDGILSDLKMFTEDKNSIISLPRIFRVTAIKK